MNLREIGIKKNIKKPLDIQGVLCYNKDNEREVIQMIDHLLDLLKTEIKSTKQELTDLAKTKRVEEYHHYQTRETTEDFVEWVNKHNELTSDLDNLHLACELLVSMLNEVGTLEKMAKSVEVVRSRVD
jgi:hypothetical protein